MLDQTTLDRLWDFENPELSERRFRDAMDDQDYDVYERAELATQLGRAIGLQGRFEEADGLLDSIDGEEEPTVGIRILIERGRILNSSGQAAMAVPLFEQAAELGDHLGEEFLAVDALHMLAIADSAHAEPWRLRPCGTLDPECAGIRLHRPRAPHETLDGGAAQQPGPDAARGGPAHRGPGGVPAGRAVGGARRDPGAAAVRA